MSIVGGGGGGGGRKCLSTCKEVYLEVNGSATHVGALHSSSHVFVLG